MKYVKLLFITVISFLMVSCASLPEPSEKVNNLVYGKVDFNFENYTNANLLPETERMQTGVEVVIQDRKTRKTYRMSTNGNGEFFHANVPAGTYRLSKIEKTVVGNGNEFIFGGKIDERAEVKHAYFFKVEDNYVNNMGTIDFDIKMLNVSSYNWSLRWGTEEAYKESTELFWKKHSDSDWLYKEWRNTDDYYRN